LEVSVVQQVVEKTASWSMFWLCDLQEESLVAVLLSSFLYLPSEITQ
jgi:hypothetical protein